MSPVATRKYIRARSESKRQRIETNAETAVPMKSTSPPICVSQPPEVDSQLKGNPMWDKMELARMIAEFRVGVPPLSTKDSLKTKRVEDADDRGMEETSSVEQHVETPCHPVNNVDLQSATFPSANIATSTTANISQQLPCTAMPAKTTPVDVTPQGADDGARTADISAVERPAAPFSARVRRRGFTANERELLEAAFHIAANPGSATMKLLVHLTGLDKKKIRGWFRTRRDRQQRDDSKAVSAQTTDPTSDEKRPSVPPQYWPEPLRISRMNLHPYSPFPPYPIPGFGVPFGPHPVGPQAIASSLTPGAWYPGSGATSIPALPPSELAPPVVAGRGSPIAGDICSDTIQPAKAMSAPAMSTMLPGGFYPPWSPYNPLIRHHVPGWTIPNGQPPPPPPPSGTLLPRPWLPLMVPQVPMHAPLVGPLVPAESKGNQ